MPPTDSPAADMDIESWVPIDHAISRIAPASPFAPCPRSPTMATVLYRGPYEAIGPAHEALHNWIHGNHYRLAGPDRLVLPRTPHSAGNPADNLIEIQYPIEPAS